MAHPPVVINGVTLTEEQRQTLWSALNELARDLQHNPFWAENGKYWADRRERHALSLEEIWHILWEGRERNVVAE